jgi:hypothetical protein
MKRTKFSQHNKKDNITAIQLKNLGSRFFSDLHSFYKIWRIEDSSYLTNIQPPKISDTVN